MCAREEIDNQINERIKKIISGYPVILEKYINSMIRKTSYTKRAYAYYVTSFLDYMRDVLKYDINNYDNFDIIKPMDIDEYMEYIRVDKDGKENSATYRSAQLAAINGFFKFLKKNEIIKSNPCAETEIPKDDKEHEIITITDKDLKIMIANIKKGVGSDKSKSTQKKWQTRDIALLRLGLSTGLRISAICGIDLNDVDFIDKSIMVTEKGKVPKRIYIGNETTKAIKEWVRDRGDMVDFTEPALFISQTGKRITPRIVQRRFQQLTEQLGKHITPHKMRATCATRLYENTGDIYIVQQQLGHKNIQNTQRYAKVSDEKKREAANILDSLY